VRVLEGAVAERQHVSELVFCMKSMVCITTAITLLFCVLLVACTRYSSTQTTNETLYGKWIWEGSSGGFTGRQTITPETVGYTKVVQFSRNGTFREFRDDRLVISADYTIVNKKTIFGYDRDVICFADSTGQMMDQVIMKLTETALCLSDPCPDCFGHSYIRMEE
jgi:hypothetical protein